MYPRPDMQFKPVLTVRNLSQKLLVDWEIKGQLSDGAWENTVPDNHWQIWNDAGVLIGNKVGRNFIAKCNYDLTKLVDYIPDRLRLIYMLGVAIENLGGLDVVFKNFSPIANKANIIYFYDETFLTLIKDSVCVPKWIREYYKQFKDVVDLEAIEKQMITVRLANRLSNDPIDKDVLKCLQDLKTIFRTKI